MELSDRIKITSSMHLFFSSTKIQFEWGRKCLLNVTRLKSNEVFGNINAWVAVVRDRFIRYVIYYSNLRKCDLSRVLERMIDPRNNSSLTWYFVFIIASHAVHGFLKPRVFPKIRSSCDLARFISGFHFILFLRRPNMLPVIWSFFPKDTSWFRDNCEATVNRGVDVPAFSLGNISDRSHDDEMYLHRRVLYLSIIFLEHLLSGTRIALKRFDPRLRDNENWQYDGNLKRCYQNSNGGWAKIDWMNEKKFVS